MYEPNGDKKKNPIDNAVEFVNNTSDHTAEFTPEDVLQNKVIAAVCYIPFLFFLPLVVCPSSKFGRFHANQSVSLFLCAAVVSLALGVVSLITSFLAPVHFVVWIVQQLFGVAVLLFVILGAVNTTNGKAKELPLVGKTKIISY